MHFLSSRLRRRFANGEYWLFAQVCGWAMCALYGGAWLLFGWVGLFVLAAAVIGTGAGLYHWLSKLKLVRSKHVARKLDDAARLDSTWNEQVIVQRVTTVFYRYQKDWSAREWSCFSDYMTASYSQHASLLVAALRQARRINEVEDPEITQMVITRVQDNPDNTKDTVTVGIMARAKDILRDEDTGDVLFTDTQEFTEYWTFKRQDDEWYLDGIEQATRTAWSRDPALQDFAKQNGFFYSHDMGWLLIPKRGQLFGRARFGSSDINNHVIGIYSNQYLLQLYTYDPMPNNQGSYLIAQTNVPRSYGSIVVRRKSAFMPFAPKGLHRISMEWGDFNRKYEVFASSAEGATSFELLHPAFMQQLEALPFTVNIEVVDNVVYLYAPRRSEKHTAAEYDVMLGILAESYKQMRM